MKPVLLAELMKNGACTREAAIFKELFGDGRVATLDDIEAVALTFDWLTARNLILTPAQQKVFDIRMRLALRVATGRSDPQQVLRRQALARAFWEAYSSPEE
jgi:hypothetical protein